MKGQPNRFLVARLLLLACASGMSILSSGAASAASTLTPEQVADLYIQTFVNRDLDSARRLNEYLKPEFSGGDAYDLGELRKFAEEKPQQDEARARDVAAEAPEAERPVLASAFLNYFQGTDHAVANAKCKATASKLRPNDVQRAMGDEAFKDAEIAEVSFSCEIPDLDAGIEQEILAAVAAQDSARLVKGTETFKAEVMKPKKLQTVTGTHNLFRTRPDSPWSSGAVDEWVTPILAGLPSMQPQPTEQ